MSIPAPSTVSIDAVDPADLSDLAQEAVELVRRWLEESRDIPVDAAARRLAGVLSDPHGLAFAVGFVDGVVRPEDRRVAARNLRALVPLTPEFLPAPMRALVRVGGALAPVLPGLVVPIARRVLRGMVRHLIVDASDARLGAALARIRRTPGVRVNVNLLGEAILGADEAARRLEGTRRLLTRNDVDYVSIKVSSTVAPHSPWAFEDAVSHAVDALYPLYASAAAEPGGPTFLNLDMEEYKDLDLTLAVFTTVLERPEFRHVEAGIVLQAYLPDALGAMIRLQEWARARVASGGAPIKVRVVKGANLPMERVDAEVHGWPLATWGSKCESDASYKAVLEYALRPEHIDAVRIGVAGHNLFDIALAWLLAQRRGVEAGIEFEMLLGMASAQAEVVRRTVGSLLLYTPVVHPAEFDVAIAYLIRRLEEGASPENFMSAVFDLDTHPELFARERDRFLDAVAAVPRTAPTPHRLQDRDAPAARGVRTDGFENTPDTDPSLAANRAWATRILAGIPGSTLGVQTVAAARVVDAATVDQTIARGVAAGPSWWDLGPAGRAELLHRAGDELERRRAQLLEVMGAEAGKVLEQGDPEVSEAIDFAHYYARSALDLAEVDGATALPAALTVVAPPWNFPVAIPAGSTLAALAAGSPVILKPAPQAQRSAAVMVEALWAAGIPRDVLQFVCLDEGELGERLLAAPEVERVILTGAYETAELFRSFRTDLPLLAETSGKNAIIVTPSADLDLAARDVASSAFGHAGQKCSAASLVILVGSVATSARFRRQLQDAVSAFPVGMPGDGVNRIGPLISPASGKLRHALTTLDPGEEWLLTPECLDEDGILWRPGIKTGVRPGSAFHLTEYFGPVLGVMTAPTLEDAIDLVNEIDYGLTSGLHSLDEREIQTWLSRVEAGNLYVNRGTTGAIVQRQPFGGWKRSAVGAGTKAGGPNYLVGLSEWQDAAPAAAPIQADALIEAAVAAVPPADAPWLRAALITDLVAWRSEFGIVRDVAAIASEQNAFRYQAAPVTVRHEDAAEVALVRVVAAGVRAGAKITVSAATRVPAAAVEWMRAAGVGIVEEDARAWSARAARLAREGGRIRIVGGSRADVAAQTGGSPAVALYTGPVVSAGRVELLTFLREQAVSISAHRFGTPRRYEVPPLAPAS